MTGDVQENAIEWITGDDFIIVTLTQAKFKNRVRKLAESNSDTVTILAENADGSLLARLPLKALHLSIMRTKEGSERNMSGLERYRQNKSV